MPGYRKPKKGLPFRATRLSLAVAGFLASSMVSADSLSISRFSVLGPGLMLWSAGSSHIYFNDLQRPQLFRSSLELTRRNDGSGVLGLWRDYALGGITPGFEVSAGGGLAANVAPSSIGNLSLMPSFSIEASFGEGSREQFILSVERGLLSESRIHNQALIRPMLSFESGSAIYQTVIAPGVGTWIGDSTRWDVSAVLANQHVGYMRNAGFRGGESVFDDSAVLGEDSHGAGVRFGFSSQLVPGVQVAASYQTKIDLDSFETYRGRSFDPADFDIPASINLKMSVEASDNLTLYFDSSRVMYGDVSTFNTFLLPDRFLSLLGDGSSPDFNWTDLSIYNVGMNWRVVDNMQLSASLGSGNQPQPGSSLLYEALVPDYAKYNATLGLSTLTDSFGQFGLSARYAPSRYDVGAFAVGTLDRVQVEAFWVLDF